MPDYYDAAQICLNGHVATASAVRYPEHRKKFCDRCGEPTIMACSKCRAEIRGRFHVEGFVGGYDDYQRPAFCHECGSAFPWTERTKSAAIGLFIEESQDEEDQRLFKSSIEEVTNDTPQAKAAGMRINRLLKKLPTTSAGIIRDMIVNIASEGIKAIVLD
jgi:hypothetical protein